MRSDADIVRVTLAGDREAFAELVERYYPLLYGVALASLRNRADAEDAAQESFLRALKSLDTLKEPTRFSSWLSSIVRNICRDMRAKELREAPLDGEAIGAIPSAEPDAAGNELYELLWDHVMALSADEREILILYYFSKQNTRAIAELLSLSVAAAEKRLQRARHSLGARMEAALGETMEQHRHRDSAAKATSLAVIACPVTWTAPAAGATGTAGTMVGAFTVWKLSAALLGVAVIVGGYFAFRGDKPLVAVNSTPAAVSQPESGGPGTEGETQSAFVSETVPAKPESGFFQVLARSVGRGRSGPVIRVIADDDPSKPIKGAQIAIFREDEPTDVLKGTTGADGNCVLSRVPASSALMSVTHRDYKPQRRIALELNRSDEMVVSLAGFDGVKLRGRVVSAETGEPIRSFSLALMGSVEHLPPRWRGGFSRFDDDDGRFEVDGGSEPLFVSATASGYATSTIQLSDDGVDVRNILFKLERAYSVTVTTLDVYNAPVPNVAITVDARSTEIDEEEYAPESEASFTDVRGRVRIENLPTMPTAVLARHPEYVLCQRRLDQAADSRDMSTTIIMGKGAAVRGTVMRGLVPEPGANVYLRLADEGSTNDERRSYFATAKADFDGKFEFAKVPAGRYQVHSSVREMSKGEVFDITNSSTHSLSIILPSRATDTDCSRISGRVTVDGEAPSAFEIELTIDSGTATYQWRTYGHPDDSGTDGSYEIDDIVAGRAKLRVTAILERQPNVTRLFELEIPPGANLAQDVPFVSTAPLTVHVDGPPDAQASLVVRAGENYETYVSGVCRTGEDIVIPGLQPGRYTIALAPLPRGLTGGLVRRGEPILYVYTPSPEPTAQPVDPLAPRLVDSVETVVDLKAGGPNYVKLSYDGNAR